MGVTFSTVFESEAPPYHTLGGDHRALARVRERLDRLATQNGLKSLLAFESYAPEDTAGLLDDETQAQQLPAKWFTPAAGLEAVDALYEYLEGHPGVFTEHAKVLEDLSGLGDELEAAQRAGVRFRFVIIM